MAISPLDIYERAYRLQYDQNDNAGAIELYKRIIAEFPDSNECGYAAVQLEKIQATGIIDEIEQLQKRGGVPVALIALIIGILAFVAAAGIGAFLYVNQSRESDIERVLARSLGAFATGQTDSALSQLVALQRKYPSDADIRSIILSIETRKSVPAVAPAAPPAVYDSAAETTETVSPAPKKSEPPAHPLPPPAPPVLSHQQKVLSQQLLAKPAAPPPRPAKPAPVGVRPAGARKSAEDSISFFP